MTVFTIVINTSQLSPLQDFSTAIIGIALPITAMVRFYYGDNWHCGVYYRQLVPHVLWTLQVKYGKD